MDGTQLNESEVRWTHPGINLTEAVSFIHGCLPNAQAVKGPVEVFARYEDGPDQRMTALFETDDPEHQKVILKANAFPLLLGSVGAHRIAAKFGANRVPALLGWAELPNGSLVLQSFFTGRLISAIRHQGDLIKVAKALGQIQAAAIGAPPASANLETFETRRFPSVFSSCIEVVRSHYREAWEPDPNEAIRRAMGFPGAEVIEKLESIKEDVGEWTDKLSKSKLPLSIDHGDCHWGNAALLDSGDVVIFDWENGCIAHPYLSAERLMTSAWALDVGAMGGPWGYKRATPTQELLRGAYLYGIGSGSVSEGKTFDAAMGLAVIKEMWHEMEWARTCGWQYQNPEWTAQLIRRLLEHRTCYRTWTK